MGQLFAALRDQGGDIAATGPDDHLPATIRGSRLLGGEVVLAEPASSQIVSGLVLAALLATSPTRLRLLDGTPARPYVDMTLAMVEAFGGTAEWEDAETIGIEPGLPWARDLPIEPDASAATYPWALAALHRGDVVVPGLAGDALQGDVAFVEVLARMGAQVEVESNGVRVIGTGRLVGVDVDLTDLPDPGLTLAVLALHAEGPTRIRGVAVHRHHETDRISAAATELRRLGAEVTEFADGLAIEPPTTPRRGVAVQTYGDHRMAMAFALAGDVLVRDPAVVGKTWPTYFAFLDGFDMVS